MFNVTRGSKAPACLSKKKYNTPEVVKALRSMFHDKCYLCEQDDLAAPEIEHLDPHEGDEDKKYDWNNLFYSCKRCNSIKSNTHKGIVDCCDSKVNVFREIQCLMPRMLDGDIEVTSTNDSLENTVTLLRKCYNEKKTGLRGITREVLVERLYDDYADYLQQRKIIKLKKSTPSQNAEAEAILKQMLKVSYPFSVFWRWQFLNDNFLKAKLPDLIDF